MGSRSLVSPSPGRTEETRPSPGRKETVVSSQFWKVAYLEEKSSSKGRGGCGPARAGRTQVVGSGSSYLAICATVGGGVFYEGYTQSLGAC